MNLSTAERNVAMAALVTWVISLMALAVAADCALAGGSENKASGARYGGLKLKKLDRKMKKGMKRLDVEGAAVGLWGGGEPEPLFVSYGWSDKAEGREVDENTVFMAASVSKAVVGTVAAIMVERGQLNLDADVNDYLDWPQEIRHPSFPDIAITARMLMTHTSALLPDAPVLYKNDWDNDYDLPSYAPEGVGGAIGNPSCPLDQLEQFMQDLLFGGNDSGVGGELVTDWNELSEEDGGVWKRYAPGNGRDYSNIGAAFLGVVLQRAGNATSIEQLFTDMLFGPVGMSTSSWFMEGIADFDERAAKHYNNRGVEQGFYCFIDYPSGSLRTTAKDLTAFMQVIARGGILQNGTRLYSQETAGQLLQCQEPAATSSGNKGCAHSYHWLIGDNFARNWYERSYASLRRKARKVCDAMAGGIFHDGAELGTGSFAAAVPGKQAVVVLLSNGEDGADLAPKALFDALVEFSKA